MQQPGLCHGPRALCGALRAPGPLQPRPRPVVATGRHAPLWTFRRWRQLRQLTLAAATGSSSSSQQQHAGPLPEATEPLPAAEEPAASQPLPQGVALPAGGAGCSAAPPSTPSSLASVATSTSSSAAQQQVPPPAFAPPEAPGAPGDAQAAPQQQQQQPAPVRAASPAAAAKPPARAPKQQQRQPPGPGVGTYWGLLVLSLAYLHHSTSAFALPSLLPIITDDLALTDSQGALLTVGYTVLYALTLVPVGLLADRVDRPRLLALGIGLWSVLTMVASQAHGFGQLLATRVGFAAAQATQNPICFSLIPELFPSGKTTAMAFYNTAIYAGRALSFAAVILAAQLGVPEGRIGDIGYTLVPLDKVDLSLVSVLYTQGDFAAITPVYAYALPGGDGALPPDSPFSGWRQLLGWLGPPGLALAVLCLLTVDEPRTAGTGGFLGDPFKSSRFLNQPISTAPPPPTARGAGSRRAPMPPPAPRTAAAASTGGAPPAAKQQPAQRGGAPPAALAPAAAAAAAAPAAGSDQAGSIGESLAKLRQLLASPKFQAITFASAINDVGSWALVSWQATFYQRVFHLSPDVYAPLLAVVIPIGGIIGGVGAGMFGDWLNRVGGRHWLTAVGNCVAAPTIALSLLAPDYRQSFAALLVGFALCEAWRAPAAVMVREASPPGLGSTASAMHLCIRNLVGGVGPIGVAYLSASVGLQRAMLLVPACYLLSGLGFVAAEVIIRQDSQRQLQLQAGGEGAGKG